MSDHFILGTFQNTQGHITQNVKSNKNKKKQKKNYQVSSQVKKKVKRECQCHRCLVGENCRGK